MPSFFGRGARFGNFSSHSSPYVRALCESEGPTHVIGAIEKYNANKITVGMASTDSLYCAPWNPSRAPRDCKVHIGENRRGVSHFIARPVVIPSFSHWEVKFAQKSSSSDRIPFN